MLESFSVGQLVKSEQTFILDFSSHIAKSDYLWDREKPALPVERWKVEYKTKIMDFNRT